MEQAASTVTNAHPASAGLRKLADILDQAAADGAGLVPVEIRVDFRAFLVYGDGRQSAVLAAAKKYFGGESRMDEYFFHHKADLEGLPLEFTFSKDEVCERVTELRPVETYRIKAAA